MTRPLTRKEQRWICIVITLLLVAPILPSVIRTTGLHETLISVVTPSLPMGWYWTSSQDSLTIGYPTLMCYPPDAVAFAVERGYFSPDSSRTHDRCSETLIIITKPLAAIPGDTVRITRDSLRVNSRQWIPAYVHDRDSKDRPLPNAIGTHVLDDGECFALSLWNSRSFDSRYIGPIPCPINPRIAIPLWPADAAHIHRMAKEIAGVIDTPSPP